MEYGKIKQGTIIHGLRSNQYPNRECSAIIITAECDIAQCKVSKFYYLSAMDVRTWMDTDGLDYTTANLQLAKFKTFINNFSGKIPELKQYQNVAVVDLDKIESDIRNLPDPIDTSPALKELSKIKMYRAQTKDVLGNLKRVINGDLTHYFFLPYNTYTAKNQKELKPMDRTTGYGFRKAFRDRSGTIWEAIFPGEKRRYDFSGGSYQASLSGTTYAVVLLCVYSDWSRFQ